MPRNIVIGVDLSDCSRAAFDAGVALAKDLGARVIAVHAFTPLAPGVGIAGGGVQRDIERATTTSREEEARQLTQQWLEQARADGVEAEAVTSAAKPEDLILDTAAAEDAQLIVVGTHGRTGIRRVLLGSVAEEIVRHSDRPVLVVPKD